MSGKGVSMKKVISATMCVMLLVGCGGRTAAPVMPVQYGDDKKSCRALEFEMNTIQGEMQRLLPDTDKTGKNVALGVAGAFLLVPWFFMDFKNAEQTEYESYRQRYNNLATVALSKNCDITPQQYPTVEELRRKYEEQQQTTQPRQRR
jgi:hypothetical protein